MWLAPLTLCLLVACLLQHGSEAAVGTVVSHGTIAIEPSAATDIPLYIKGHATQSANLLSLVDTGDTAMFTISSAGAGYLADSVFTYSDSRWKKDVKAVEGALEKVCALRGVTYLWNSDAPSSSTALKYGLIAQEVQQVVPELVAEVDDEGHLGVQYATLTSLLVEAVKEQQVTIAALEKRVAALEDGGQHQERAATA